MIISLIAAMAENRIIGKDGAIPWHIPEDLKRFRELTWGHKIIVGRKTFESIGRPLPGRTTIILTRQLEYRAEGCMVVHDLAAALAACGSADEVFVCGGAEVYREAMPVADRIYLTVVHGSFPGDTLFPEVPDYFVEESRRQLSSSVPCEIFVLVRVKV